MHVPERCRAVRMPSKIVRGELQYNRYIDQVLHTYTDTQRDATYCVHNMVCTEDHTSIQCHVTLPHCPSTQGTANTALPLLHSCPHTLYTYTVHIYTLPTCTVHVHCPHTLYTCIVHIHCPHTPSTHTVHMHCPHSVHMHCPHTLLCPMRTESIRQCVGTQY